MKIFLTVILVLSFLTGCARSGTTLLQSEKDRINYSVGYQIGQDFQKQGVSLESRTLVRGIRDAASDKQPLMTQGEMQKTLVALKKRILDEEKDRQKQAQETYRGEGREFLSENAKKEGIVVMESGLQYRILEEGSGSRPKISDQVKVHYQGRLIDGTEFDSSYRRGEPEVIPLANVIPGWKEALPMMREGARWRLFIPSDLAFGEQGPLADQVVIYDVELLEIVP